MNEQEATKKFLIVTAFTVPWVITYSVMIVCFTPGWMAILTVLSFYIMIAAIGRNLL